MKRILYRIALQIAFAFLNGSCYKYKSRFASNFYEQDILSMGRFMTTKKNFNYFLHLIDSLLNTLSFSTTIFNERTKESK